MAVVAVVMVAIVVVATVAVAMTVVVVVVMMTVAVLVTVAGNLHVQPELGCVGALRGYGSSEGDQTNRDE